MSCGNPHDTDCSEVLELVYEFLDGETTDAIAPASPSTSTSASPACASTASSRRSRPSSTGPAL